MILIPVMEERNFLQYDLLENTIILYSENVKVFSSPSADFIAMQMS